MAEFQELINAIRPRQPGRVAVAAAEDDAVLQAVAQAHAMGIATPVLCGDREQIGQVAERCGVDVSLFELVQAGTSWQAAQAAVALVREGRADMLMKGQLQTSDLLRAVLDRQQGLRGDGVLSHVGVMQSPILDRMLLLTDAGMITYPDLMTKAKMIDNAVTAARGMGIACPKVAPLAAVEVVNPDMQATLDAAALTVMNWRGQIRNCVVDGPLAMDLALSAEAAEHKGIDSPVAGRADILLFHNIEAANSTLKTLTIAGNCLFGGVIMGAAAPIVLTSRSDSDKSKLYSIACAASICRGGQ